MDVSATRETRTKVDCIQWYMSRDISLFRYIVFFMLLFFIYPKFPTIDIFLIYVEMGRVEGSPLDLVVCLKLYCYMFSLVSTRAAPMYSVVNFHYSIS